MYALHYMVSSRTYTGQTNELNADCESMFDSEVQMCYDSKQLRKAMALHTDCKRIRNLKHSSSTARQFEVAQK